MDLEGNAMVFLRKGDEHIEAVPNSLGVACARLRDTWIAFIDPAVPWHRLNEYLLRDIGKTAADAELEAYLRSFGTTPFPRSLEGPLR